MNAPLRTSLWFKPAGPARERLRAAALRARVELGGAEFEPHLTLLSGIELPLDAAQRALVQVAARVPPLLIRVVGCAHSAQRMRSLYLRVRLTPELADARRAAENICGAAAGADFEPHISLVYGSSDAAAKQRLCAQLGPELSDLTFMAESLHLVNAASRLPVEDWHVLAEKTLRPESSAE